MYIITESLEIINTDAYHRFGIREVERTGINDETVKVFEVAAFGKDNIEDCPIICFNKHFDAIESINNLYDALQNNDRAWRATNSIRHAKRKEVTLHLADCIQDEKTGNSVVLHGAKLSGTLLQVGMIFDVIKDIPGTPDVIGVEENVEVYKACQEALKYARECPDNPDGSFEYIDPNRY